MKVSLHKTNESMRSLQRHAETHTHTHMQKNTHFIPTHQAREGTAHSASVSSTGSNTVTMDPIGADGCWLPLRALRGRVPRAVHAALSQLFVVGSVV